MGPEGAAGGMGKLTAIGAKALTEPGRYSDGDGLHLHVRSVQRKEGAGVRRAWVYRYMRGRQAHDLGLGAFPDVSLAQARAAAAEARRLLREGRDPIAERKAQAKGQDGVDMSFRAAAEQLIRDRAAAWSSDKHTREWGDTLERYAYPVFGDRHVQDVDTEAVLRVLRPIWTTKTETASRLRGRIEAVLDAAKVLRWREGENPARWKGHLAALLAKPNKVAAVQHHPALPWRLLPAFLVDLRSRRGLAARAIDWTVLTLARSGETRGLRRQELDFDAATWTVPAGRMKSRRVHRVPLSTAALDLLREIDVERMTPDQFVFPGVRSKKPLDDKSLTLVLGRMNATKDDRPAPWLDGQTGEPITVHGFRSTFRVWAGETTEYPRELIEMALAHAVESDVEAAYARTDLLERRRSLMEGWGRFCSGLGGDPNVASGSPST